jgi:hypothetical protein
VLGEVGNQDALLAMMRVELCNFTVYAPQQASAAADLIVFGGVNPAWTTAGCARPNLGSCGKTDHHSSVAKISLHQDHFRKICEHATTHSIKKYPFNNSPERIT